MIEPAELLEGRNDREDLGSRTLPELRTLLAEVEEKVRFGEEHSAESIFVGMLRDDAHIIRAELERRNGTRPPIEPGVDPIADALSAAGFPELKEGAEAAKIEAVLRNLVVVLDGADTLRRATVREAAIKKLTQVGVSAPARLLDAAIPGTASAPRDTAGQEIAFTDPEPWPKAVDGGELLTELTAFFERFLILPPHAARAIALWVMHAYTLDAFDISPILAATSATKRAAKTTQLELISILTTRAVLASNITPASLFRAVEKFKPVLLIDEADTFLRDSDELRGILNAGHRRTSAFVVRTVGDEHEPKLFSTWCAKAIALIGKLPGTLEDRSILIQMKRKAPNESVERFRPDKARAESEELRRKAARWSVDYIAMLRESDPETPGSLNDRAADNWRPLLAIADLAGGEWPERARAAALALSENVDEAENSALIQLLNDLRELFETREVDRLASSEIAETLGAMEERPWSEWRRGKPLTQRQLAKLLAPLGITPRTIRMGDSTAKGYFLDQFTDPFSRYLPFRSVTPSQAALGVGLRVISDPSQKAGVTDRKTGLSTQEIRDVTDVTDRKPLFPEGSKIWTQEV